MTDETKPQKAIAKRKFEVAPGKSLCFGPRVADKAKSGEVVELTAAEFKRFPKGSLLPYVEDMDDDTAKSEQE
jgi:hypothetical protein